jgi:hypothetical protein
MDPTATYNKQFESREKVLTNTMRSMEGVAFDSILDLNMGYYHIKLDSDAQSYVPLYFHGT